jgi:chemotaxis protein CheD
MSDIVVGVADCKHTRGEASVLVTYALGSCIAVGIWDPVSKVAGMLHFVLPESRGERDGGVEQPCRYADTGAALLFRTAYDLGAERHRLRVYIAGGASVVDDRGLFNVGQRNHAAIRKLLWKAGILLHGEDVGGTHSRTARLETSSGRFVISTPGREDREVPRHGSRMAIP